MAAAVGRPASGIRGGSALGEADAEITGVRAPSIDCDRNRNVGEGRYPVDVDSGGGEGRAASSIRPRVQKKNQWEEMNCAKPSHAIFPSASQFLNCIPLLHPWALRFRWVDTYRRFPFGIWRPL